MGPWWRRTVGDTSRFGVAAAVALLAVVPAASGQPAIEIGDRTITVTGATPGHAVAWFGVGTSTPRWIPRVVSLSGVVEEADGGGATRVAVDVDIPANSIWVAADIATGQFAVAAPDSATDRRVIPAMAAVRREARRLSLTSDLLEPRRLHLLVVRRGVGAWTLLSRDGGPHDRDLAPRSQVLDLADLEPLGAATPALDELQPGDVLAVIDSQDMRYFVVRIGES